MSKDEILISCDIGTSTIKVIISQVESGMLNIIGVGTAPSQGVRKGTIIDIEMAVMAIRQAIEEAERMVGFKISKVNVGLGAHHVEIVPCSGIVAINSPDRVVTEEDKIRVKMHAELVQIPQDREIIDLIPLKYKVDEIDNVNDPKGMTGIRLEMRGLIITSLKTIVHNTRRAIEYADLNISNIVFNPVAISSLILSDDEKQMGVCLIDFGGETTTVSIFMDQQIKTSFVIPLGGDTITKDLSIVLKTKTEDAEKLKLQYGNAFIDREAEDEIIPVPMLGSEKLQNVSQQLVAEIIEARASEILEMIHEEIGKRGYNKAFSSIVLTGGTVRMPGVNELTEYIFQKQVRSAEPNYIGVREPRFSASVGVLNYIARKTITTEETVASPPHQEKSIKKVNLTEESGSTKIKKFISSFFE